MRRLIVVGLFALVMGLVGSNAAEAQEKGKASIVGTWEGKIMDPNIKFEIVLTLTFDKDGKATMMVEFGGKKSGDGDVATYKHEGDKLIITAKKGGKDSEETLTIKELTEDKLILLPPKDKKGGPDELVFKRKK